MQNWEYLFVVCNLEKREWKAKVVNENEVKNWKRTIPMFEYASQLGEKGWELVNCAPVFSESATVYVKW